jgi:hypothetical protein
LPEILLVILSGVMAGAEDFVEIERRAKRKLGFLRSFLSFENGIPGHDTLNDVMNALPGELFCECFTGRVETLRENDPEIVAIDGKSSRRAHGRDGRQSWSCLVRQFGGEVKVDSYFTDHAASA